MIFFNVLCLFPCYAIAMYFFSVAMLYASAMLCYFCLRIAMLLSSLLLLSHFSYNYHTYFAMCYYLLNCYLLLTIIAIPHLKLQSLQSFLSNRNNSADPPLTLHRRAHHDRQSRKEFSSSGQFRPLSRSHSPHQATSSKPFSHHCTSPPPYNQPYTPSCSPSKSSFFSQMQTPRVPWSALYA
jgi:hypothetical protein